MIVFFILKNHLLYSIHQNPNHNLITQDGDCDGIAKADDCDDAAASSTAIADDADCAGILTADDCSDAAPSSFALAKDGDCDDSDATAGLDDGCGGL